MVRPIAVLFDRRAAGSWVRFYVLSARRNRFVDSDVVASTGETNTFNVPADVYDMSIDASLIKVNDWPRGQIVGPGAVSGNSVYSYTITWDNNVVAPQWQIRITDPVNPPPDVVTPIVIHGEYYVYKHNYRVRRLH